MTIGEPVSGEKRGWSLLEKLGEGDAGEVYLVESLLDKKTAILKRPRRSPFSSDILRQAAQIETEGKILRAMDGLKLDRPGWRLHVPMLYDQSKAGTEFSERLFIVLEKAPGYDLGSLAKLARFGLQEGGNGFLSADDQERSFLAVLAQRGAIPRLVLLRALAGLIELFEKIHARPVMIDGADLYGVLWNDVKPEHLFWDPRQALFTVIDWGNSQFLESNGATKDRRYSVQEDYSQFVQEMGKFLTAHAADLHAELDWPQDPLLPSAYVEAVDALKERVEGLLQVELDGLGEARRQEAALILDPAPELEQERELHSIQARITAYGELPDTCGAQRFYSQLARRLAETGRVRDFQDLCAALAQRETCEPEKWALLSQMADLVETGELDDEESLFIPALLGGIEGRWADSLWELLAATGGDPDPAWWNSLSERIRTIELGLGPDSLTPFVTVNRAMHTLQAALLKLEDQQVRQDTSTPAEEEVPGLMLEAHQRIVHTLKEEILKKWVQLEPDPPDAGLEYKDIDRVLDEMNNLAPTAGGLVAKSLSQPRAQIKLALDAWRRKEFESALQGLRHALLWDPDRLRVLTAELAILRTPSWLDRVHQGPERGEPLLDYMTEVELDGRELRNATAPALWLDVLLETLSKLRNGASPADLLLEHPDLQDDMPWLNEYEARRPEPVKRSHPIVLDRTRVPPLTEALLVGMKEGELGLEGAVSLAESLDTWAPEARGSSARVFLGALRGSNGTSRPCAVKVMRPGREDYALPLFREEAHILTLMRDTPGVTGILECGFLRLDDGQTFPSDERTTSASELTGKAMRYGAGEMRDFLTVLDSRTGQGWLPYLAMDLRKREQNLMVLCDTGYTRGRFLPLPEGLVMAIQILDILNVAHSRHIAYRDHKILHYYWQEENNGIAMIDWNVAKRYPQGLTHVERSFDLVQFGARALHHILTGRSAPGALPLGPNRPDEIEAAARTYTARWTYDDQRLPTVLKDLIERVLSGGYTEARALRDDLKSVFLQMTERG